LSVAEAAVKVYISYKKNMISQKNSRNTAVNGTSFRYKISLTPISKGRYKLNFTAQSINDNGSRLVVDGLESRDLAVLPWDKPDDHKYYPTITRHEATWLIQQAIIQGWAYTDKGNNFIIKSNNEIFEYDFLAKQVAKGLYSPQENNPIQTQQTNES